MWDSLTSYFNTYYNAGRIFDEAEKEMWDLPDTRYSGQNYLAIDHCPPPTKVKFNSVIEKCSKILFDSPNSNLVDDALMMIGTSYYYMGEHQRAERKFNELIEGNPESGLVLEARMMLAYTYYKAKSTVLATETAVSLERLAREDGDGQIQAKALAILAELDIDAENYDSAVNRLIESSKLEGNRDQRATLFLKMGDLLDQAGDYERAEEAYEEAASSSSQHVGEYEGYLGAARMLAKQGDSDGALDELDDLRYNDNYREFFPDIHLEIGNVLRDANDLDQALEMYGYVDTAYARTEPAANAVFETGRIYEERLGLYDSARVTYTRGRRVFPQAEITKEILRRSTYMDRYFKTLEEILEYDSLRTAILNPVEPPPPEVDEEDTSASAADSLAAQPQGPVLSLDSVKTLLAGSRSEMGGLFFNTINVPDSARYWYTLVVEEHPESRYGSLALFAIAQLQSRDSTAPPGIADSLYRQVVEQYPGTVFAQEARRILGMPPGMLTSDPGESLYADAEQSYLNGDFTSAIQSYSSIVDQYPESAFSPKAQYAIGYIYEYSLEMPDSAVANYEKLVAMYPGTEYAQRVRPKLLEVEAVRLAAAARLDSIAAAQADSLAALQPDSLVAGQVDSLAAGQVDSLAAAQPDSLTAAQTDTTGVGQTDSVATVPSDTSQTPAPPDTTTITPPPRGTGPGEEGLSAASGVPGFPMRSAILLAPGVPPGRGWGFG
jgi:TolA-binding protein